MPRLGTFGGFDFDPVVFADYIAEQPTWSNAIIVSGILREDPTIMDKVGTRGNVAALPFYKAIDIKDYEPYNNDGKTDNTPKDVEGGNQLAMLTQRMMAWKAQDFTQELTGADPMTHIANSVTNYYQQVWERELMLIVDAVMRLEAMRGHVMDISATGTTVADSNKVDETTMIYAEQKALGDAQNRFGIAIMHSMILARYKALKLVEYAKFTEADGLTREVTLPTINGKIVVESDRYTVDTTGDIPKYITTVVGQGAILTAPKTNIKEPYYVDYDPETKAGIEKLYTKQARVLHPNGFNFKVNNIAEESPTVEENSNTENWELAFNEKNIRIGQIISNG